MKILCTTSLEQPLFSKKKKMFFSGYRVSETCDNNMSGNSDCDYSDDSDSLTSKDVPDSSSSDMLNQIDDINDFMYKRRERKASLTLQLPKNMCPTELYNNKNS